MAEYNGDNYDIAENFDPSSDSKLAQGKWGGKVRVQIDTYTINAKASGTVINVAKMPKGAHFLTALIIHEALGASVTLAYGDSGDADRYLAATSAASAGNIECRKIDGAGYKFTSDTTLFLTTGGATTASADRVIKVITLYSLE